MTLNNSYFVMPLNMDRACRICLMENTNLQPIFCSRQTIDGNLDLPQKIQLCGGVDCQEQDGLPTLICGVCMYKANIAFEFRQLCQHSDARLRMYYNKPAKFNSATDSGTQTDLQTQVLLTKSDEGLQESYYVKEETMNGQQFHNSIASGEYHSEAQTNAVVTSIAASISTVNVNNISVPEQKLFDCHLTFDEQSKDISKNSETIPCNTQSVNCGQELIPVNVNLINGVCGIDTGISVVDDVKNNVNYYYMEKDQTLTEDTNLQKQGLDDKSKSMENDQFTSEEIEDDYFVEDTENQTQEEKKYKCKSCPKTYTTQLGCRKHQLTHDKQYKCETCFKTFCKLENFEKHKPIHNTKPYACHMCSTCFSKPESLDAHIKSHIEKDNYFKQLNSDNPISESNEKINCKSEDSDDENGNQSIDLESATKNFKCEECGQYCSSLKNLKRHTLIHGEKKYSCTVCKKWFFRPDTLKKHAEKHGHGLLDNMSDSNKLYESDDDVFPSVDSIKSDSGNNCKKEESEDENSGEYKCQHCDKVMTTKKGLRRHVAMHKPKPEPAVCEVCKKVCASRARLALHQKIHSKPKEKVPREYLCHICSKVYPSNSSLTYHMRTHTGVKPHVCKTCNSGFTTTTSLANHIRIHTGDKPFVCHVCSAAFAVSSAFRRHLTRHTGEANYHCKTCGKAFKRLSTLKEHTYTHSGEKPYVCKTCNAAYSHSGSLFAHQKRCRATEMIAESNQNSDDVHVNNVQSAVRSLPVINEIF
ncbi:zinc finger protein 665-like [Copidosoma floridanum]|uniref:zinc finger protein 665-like n=1 Tax=Copidosoma floridanum TaxID=29053 RepID=UPI0006C96310|nr:zinc finger protein 665-like [Copidosoma floridanum]XP_014210536.1 zinc finger protein 665-like [Copidosoma floridanum]